MKHLICLCLCCLITTIYAQNQVAPPQHISQEDWRLQLAETISEADIKSHIYTLASDKYEGRETGTAGNDMAAEYIAAHMERNGLKPMGDDNTYYQNIEFNWAKWQDISLTIRDAKYNHLWDFFSSPGNNSSLPEFSFEEIVFAGYGIQNEQFNDYQKLDVRDKAILIYSGEPRDSDGNSMITKNKETSKWSNDLMLKLRVAKKEGAKFVFVVAEDFKRALNINRRSMRGRRVSLRKPGDNKDVVPNHMTISTNVAKALLGNKQKKVIKNRNRISRGKALKSFRIKTNIRGVMDISNVQFLSKNVIGLLEGKNATKKEDHIVITAHYDHLGKRGDDIFNGADDNASGTTAVLELIKAYAHGRAFNVQQDRSLLFILFTGEEKGLLGSAFYAEDPIIAFENTMVNINLDMMGRVDKKHEDQADYIYVIGADRLSTDLHKINESVNNAYEQLVLDYTFNAEDDPNRYYYRSDHYNFASNGVPSIFFFNGTHDDYHRPGDTVDKINLSALEKRGRHVFHLVWELANRDKAIEVDVN